MLKMKANKQSIVDSRWFQWQLQEVNPPLGTWPCTVHTGTQAHIFPKVQEKPCCHALTGWSRKYEIPI